MNRRYLFLGKAVSLPAGNWPMVEHRGLKSFSIAVFGVVFSPYAHSLKAKNKLDDESEMMRCRQLFKRNHTGNPADPICGIHFRYGLVLLIVFAHIVAMCLPENGYGSEDGFSGLFDENGKQPWHITADEIDYDEKSRLYNARGNVRIDKPGKSIFADRIRFDQVTMEAVADGHVKMRVGEDYLSGERLEINLDDETGILYDGVVFVKENHFYIRGDSIRKIGPYAYEAEKASVSTCDGDVPDWKITGENLKVTLDGYGVATHAAFWAKKLPLLYSPYLVFPVKLKRQTGFLMPQIGYSDRKGVEINQPFYWAINESSDATFYEYYMQQRGNKAGVEYRYVLDEQSKGALFVDVLNDRKVDDGSGDSSANWGYESDDALRPNSDRYWIRMKHDQPLAYDLFARLDIDIVSDQDYLDEFKEGYSGFDETAAYFNAQFGRQLDDYDDPVRVNRLNISRLWPVFTFNAQARWYEDATKYDSDQSDTTLQQLPSVQFDALKQSVSGTPFYYDLDSEYIYYYREDGTRGHRLDVYPRLYRPYRFKQCVTIEPSVGLRQTLWSVDQYDDFEDGRDRTLSRQVADVGLDFASRLFHVYEVDGARVDRIKHDLIPRIEYDYIPGQNQDEYPMFDSIDRIGKKNRISYSITNIITYRSRVKAAAGNSSPDSRNSDADYNYTRFCRLKLGQSYDLEEAEEDPDRMENEQYRQPFSPVKAELELVPWSFISLQADAEWAPYENELISNNVSLSLKGQRDNRLSLEYRYSKNTSESVSMDLRLKVTDALAVYADYEYNLFDTLKIRQSTGFLYQSQCWSIDVCYTDEDDDQGIRAMVSLSGF